ncbi:MAG: hypothetical protein J6W75_04250 [Bacteroidaceae bacterium]|nr:hypothetical protein [Bacteroidaceae bacterium]
MKPPKEAQTRQGRKEEIRAKRGENALIRRQDAHPACILCRRQPSEVIIR